MQKTCNLLQGSSLIEIKVIRCRESNHILISTDWYEREIMCVSVVRLIDIDGLKLDKVLEGINLKSVNPL